MAKNKLVNHHLYDFQLLGIICKKKDHQLAWSLNQSGHFNFFRASDLKIEFKDTLKMIISIFEDKSEFHCYTLLKNKPLVTNSAKNQYLLPEQHTFDYLLKLESSLDDFSLDEIVKKLREIDWIDYLVRLNLEKIKQRENLLF